MAAIAAKLFGDGYNKADKERMRRIHGVFSATVGQGGENGEAGAPIPKELTMDEKFERPLTKSSVDFMTPTYWSAKMRNGPLRAYVDEAINRIVQFETVRRGRLIGSGELNDPTYLFLLELKEWLVTLTIQTTLDPTIGAEIKRRIHYLDRIEKAEVPIFPSGRANTDSESMILTLMEIRFILEKRVKAQIDAAIANLCARDHFQNLQNSLMLFINNTFKFLCYAFRDTKNIARDASVSNVRDGGAKVICATLSGQYLQIIARSNAMRKIYPTNIAFNIETKSLVLVKDERGELAAPDPDANPFINGNGDACAPALMTDATTVAADAMPLGITHCFVANRELMSTFYRMHALLLGLAELAAQCEDARRLAGGGGDLLVYGVTSNSVIKLMEAYFRLATGINNVLDVMCQAVEIAYKQRVKSGEVDQWLKNYKMVQVSTIADEIRANMSACDTTAATIRGFAETKISKNWLNQLQEDTNRFVRNSQSFSKNVAHLLGVPEPDEPQIGDVERPLQISLDEISMGVFASDEVERADGEEGGGAGASNVPRLTDAPRAAKSPATAKPRVSPMVILEHQRRLPFSEYHQRFLTLADHRAFADPEDSDAVYTSLEKVACPAGNRWTGDWARDMSESDTEGWQYAFNFEGIATHTWSNESSLTTWVRRRKWTRPFVSSM